MSYLLRHPEVLARLGEPRRMAAREVPVAILRGPRERRGHLRMTVIDYKDWYNQLLTTLRNWIVTALVSNS
jgi:hypothetical protein